MVKLWEKTIVFQTKCENRWKSWRKRVKDKRKRRNEGRDLPELNDMLRARNGLLIAIGFSLLFASTNVYTHWFDMPADKEAVYRYSPGGPILVKQWYQGLDLYAQGFAMLLTVFAWVYDYSIWKRFGKEFSVIDYS